MIVKKDDRVKTVRDKLKDGQGAINIFDLTTKQSIPNNLRLCSEFILKPNESIGSHAHIGETDYIW